MISHNKKIYKELAEKVESGEYFLEAREWYLKQYMYNFIERSYLLALIAAVGVLMLMCYMYYEAILPIKKSLPIKVSISSTADFSTKITYLGNAEKKFDINHVLIKYFSGRFVEAIESYDFKSDFKKLKVSRNIIKTLATSDILSYYTDKISIRNPDSITLKFRKKISRIINVEKEKIEISELTGENSSSYNDESNENSSDIKKYQTTVNFDATEFNKETGEKFISKWQAKIILSFQTIEYNHDVKDFTDLNFKVLSYESKKIN